MSLADLTLDLMSVPGLAGHEDRIRARIREHLGVLETRTDRLGNLWTTREGTGPVVLLFTHMDQLGFVVRRIEPEGFLRLERLGGVPEKALPSQEVLIPLADGADVYGIIASKSHHATAPEEKYTVTPYRDLYVDCGFGSRAEAEAAGIRIGAPVVYAPGGYRLGPHRLAGPAIDDRAGCAVLIEVAHALTQSTGATIHTAFTVQEEFNLRGAQPLAQRLHPDIAIQVGSPAMNLIEGRVAGGAVEVLGVRFPLNAASGLPDGRAVLCGVRPEHFLLDDGGIEVTVAVVEPTGLETHVVAHADGQNVVSLFRERHAFRPGERIRLAPDPAAVHLFDRDSGQRIA